MEVTVPWKARTHRCSLSGSIRGAGAPISAAIRRTAAISRTVPPRRRHSVCWTVLRLGYIRRSDRVLEVLARGLPSRFETRPWCGNVLRPWQIRAELVAPERAEADDDDDECPEDDPDYPDCPDCPDKDERGDIGPSERRPFEHASADPVEYR